MDRAPCEPDLFEQCERAIAEIRMRTLGRSELASTFSTAVSVGIKWKCWKTRSDDPLRSESSPQLITQIAEVEHKPEQTTAR
jgi:hypothetical protein